MIAAVAVTTTSPAGFRRANLLTEQRRQDDQAGAGERVLVVA
jgi:hypothetical protein